MPYAVTQLMKKCGVIRFRAVKARRARHMQGIGDGCVAGPLMALEDRGSVGHSVHQLCAALHGGEAVRGYGALRHRHAVELRGVEHREVPEHKALLLVPGFLVLFGIHLPEDNWHAALALANAASSCFDLVERRPERGG